MKEHKIRLVYRFLCIFFSLCLMGTFISDYMVSADEQAISAEVDETALDNGSSLSDIGEPIYYVDESAKDGMGLSGDEENDLEKIEYEYEEIKYLIDNEKRVAIVAGSSSTSMKKLVVPAMIVFEGSEIPVTGIKEYAFEGSKLTSVKIGSGVTDIGEGAFAFSSKLQKVSVPSGCLTIGDAAFFMCKKLKKVSMSKKASVEYIGDGAFAGTKLGSFSIPNAVLFIGEAAFSDCKSLTKVVIGSKLETLGEGAFSGCTSISSISKSKKNSNFEVQDNIIYSKGFADLLSAPSTSGTVDLPDGIHSVKARAFEDNVNMLSLKLPDGVTTIGEGAFLNCSSLEYMTLPQSLESIGENAFFGCTALKELNIPGSVTNIEGNPFMYCSKLSQLTVSKANKSYKSSDGMLLSHDGKNVVSAPAVYGIVVLGSKCRYINDYAFCGNNLVKAVKLNAKLVSVGEGAFYDCSQLAVIQPGSENTAIADMEQLKDILISYSLD